MNQDIYSVDVWGPIERAADEACRGEGADE